MVSRIAFALVGAAALLVQPTLRGIDPVTSNKLGSQSPSINLLARREVTNHPSRMLPSNSEPSSMGALAPMEFFASTTAPHQLPAGTVSALREVYVWAWPLIYMSNLKQSLQMIGTPGHSGGAP